MDFKEIPDSYKDIRINVSRAIDEKSSIELKEVDDMNFVLNLLKEVFKDKKVNYRVRTNKRASVPGKLTGGGATIIGASMAMEATAVAAPIVVGSIAMAGAALTGAGAVVLAGIAAHRIFTSNPDYEIIKYPSNKEIHLIYKK